MSRSEILCLGERGWQNAGMGTVAIESACSRRIHRADFVLSVDVSVQVSPTIEPSNPPYETSWLFEAWKARPFCSRPLGGRPASRSVQLVPSQPQVSAT